MKIDKYVEKGMTESQLYNRDQTWRSASTFNRQNQETTNKIIPFSTSESDIEHLIKRISASKPEHYLQWICTGDSKNTTLIPVEEVLYLKADTKYTTVVTKEKEYLIRTTIKELLVLLNPNNFWQIHRGIIVNVPHIACIEKDINGTCHVHLNETKDNLPVSRRFTHRFKPM